MKLGTLTDTGRRYTRVCAGIRHDAGGHLGARVQRSRATVAAAAGERFTADWAVFRDASTSWLVRVQRCTLKGYRPSNSLPPAQPSEGG